MNTPDISVLGKGGMVVCSRAEACRIGIEILEKGGNAYDAAVAVALSLAVLEPQMSGLGGGGFMTGHLADGKNIFVDFREVAPHYADPSIWDYDADGKLKGDSKNTGARSVCVPGEVAGLCHILEKYGTMRLDEVIAPAIRLAKDGFRVTKLLSMDVASHRSMFERFQEEENPYQQDQWNEGDLAKNLPLARSLELLARDGRKAFYDGELTEKLIRSLNRHGAKYVPEDFTDYRVHEYEPVRGTYRGYEILSSPLPSSGGSHVVENLNILENFDLPSMPFRSPERIHLLSETFKMSFADRAQFMADPAFAHVPAKGIVSKEYAKERAAQIVYGKIAEPAFGEPERYESADTTHFSVADGKGNLVSWTQTVSNFFGSGIVAGGTGIVLNSQMTGFTPGWGRANCVAPGKKPLSSMSPSIVLKDGRPAAAIGSPGANRIITAVTQVISNMIDYNMSIADAVFAPRISNELNNVLRYETRMDPASMAKLKSFGQKLLPLQPFERFMGGVNAISIDEDGYMMGAADPRRNGFAMAYQQECTTVTNA